MHSQEAMRRFNVHLGDGDGPPMVFAHGFGCDQTMWRFVAPAFESSHRVVLFDHIGCGRSDIACYDERRHATLDGYAQDTVDMLDGLDLRDVVFVGHSVSSMIGALAAIQRPERFDRLIMLGPSPRYLNDPPDYHGGFEPGDIENLAQMMDRNLVGWADYLSGVVVGQPDGREATEIKASFCATDPDILKRFAAATFLGDNRRDLARVTVPTLVVQIERDAIAPVSVGRFCAEQLPRGRLVILPTTGHCPHLTHPAETIAAIRDYLAS